MGIVIDLPVVWAFVIAFAVFAYVAMDGFDLGLGMLFFFAGYEIDFERIRGSPLRLAALALLGLYLPNLYVNAKADRRIATAASLVDTVDKLQKTKTLNENLNPLKRYLASQVGRPWRKVYSEISEHLKPTSTVQQHVRDHLQDFVATKTRMKGGAVVVTHTAPSGRLEAALDALSELDDVRGRPRAMRLIAERGV